MVPIMFRTTTTTYPLPYSQPFLTLWATACFARRTGYGRKTFVSFFEDTPVLNSFISEHITECRPASVKNGFSHSGSGELACIHIADNDVSVFAHELCRMLMQKMFSCVCYFRMDGFSAFLVIGSLRNSQLLFVFSEKSGCLYLGSITQGSEFFQAQINTDTWTFTWFLYLNLATEINVPAPSSITAERTGFENSINISGVPEPVISAEVINFGISDPDSTVDKGNPTKIFLIGAPAGTALDSVTSGDKLPTNGLDSVRMQTQFTGSSSTQFDQVKRLWPIHIQTAFSSAFSLLLSGYAKVPYEINSTGMALKVFRCGSIFYTVLICNHRHDSIIKNMRLNAMKYLKYPQRKGPRSAPA